MPFGSRFASAPAEALVFQNKLSRSVGYRLSRAAPFSWRRPYAAQMNWIFPPVRYNGASAGYFHEEATALGVLWAVGARLRWPSRSWMVRTSVPIGSRFPTGALRRRGA